MVLIAHFAVLWINAKILDSGCADKGIGIAFAEVGILVRL